MTIIRHIDQQLFHCLIRDPTMKRVDNLFQIDRHLAVHKKLHVDMLQIHELAPKALRPSLRILL